MSDHNQSVGLGDTVHKIAEATGLNRLAELYTEITGKDCGCMARQEKLNRLVQYGDRNTSNPGYRTTEG